MQSKIDNQKSKIEVTLSPTLRLAQALEKAGVENPASITKLTVDGTLAENDYWFICSCMDELQEIDMSKASVEIIPRHAFSNSKALSSVIIPNSTKVIEHWAFPSGNNMTSIFIPASVNVIENEAFPYCAGLTSITVCPDNAVFASLDGVLFSKDMSVLLLYPRGRQGDYAIPASVVEISQGAFFRCNGLTSVFIPDSVVNIGHSAFSECGTLTAVSVPNSVTKIENCTFSESKALTIIDIPNSVLELGRSTFEDCTGLTSISIPDSVTEIEMNAFSGCKGLKSINIPNSVVAIEKKAFYKCTGLKSVVIPDAVEIIDSQAFGNCSGLTSVTIPASVVNIAKDAFENCRRAAISIHPDNPVYSYENGDFKRKNILTANISVHASPERPLEQALKEAGIDDPAAITKLTVSGMITYCDMRYITDNMAENLQELDMGAASIEGNNISNFDNFTSLNSIIIPNSVESIGMQAFSGCTALTSVNINGVEGCSVPDTIKHIDCEAFSGCSALTAINIPNSVEYIGQMAFGGCIGLTSLVVPNSVTDIDKFAFSDCTRLTSIHIADSVENIGEWAFSDCTRLTSVTLSKSLKEISDRTFCGCTALKSLTIPDSVVEIGDEAFARTGLEALTIPKSVTSIGKHAFRRCKARISVHPDNPAYTARNGKITLKKVVASGKIDDLEWKVAGGVLTISGTGEIPDYDDHFRGERYGKVTQEGRSPWYPYRKVIKKIVFNGDYISLKGLFAFSGCRNCDAVTFGGASGTINQVFHGFDYHDTIEMFGWFSLMITDALQGFKKASNSYGVHPSEMTLEEWHEILDRISFCFSEIKDGKSALDCEIKEKYLENIRNEGFELFKKHFWSLWW